jgi:HEAT repeat protein
MTDRSRSLVVGAAAVVAAVLAIYLGLRAGGGQGRAGGEPKPPPVAATERTGAGPAGGSILLTRAGLLAFLTTQASPAVVEPGQTTYLFPELRSDALEALALVDPEKAATLLQQTLAGDGEPDSWSAERLLAARLRLRAGQADGGETITAWLRAYPNPTEAEGVGAAAEAASWMGAEAGGAAVRQMLGAPLEDYDEDHLAAVLQAAAVLKAGTSVAQLRSILAGGVEAWGFRVLGAAAGALKGLGDDGGQRVLDLAAADDWFEADEVAAGLAMRGNTAVLLWLDQLLGCEDASTRAQAARSLRIVGDAAALPSLRQALGDDHPDVRAEAAISLAVLGDDSALAGVRSGLGSTNSSTAIDAWKTLAGRGDAASRPAAEKLLAAPLPPADDLRRGPALRTRVWAAVVLVRAQEAPAKP